jgi:hypothetical protein
LRPVHGAHRTTFVAAATTAPGRPRPSARAAPQTPFLVAHIMARRKYPVPRAVFCLESRKQKCPCAVFDASTGSHTGKIPPHLVASGERNHQPLSLRCPQRPVHDPDYECPPENRAWSRHPTQTGYIPLTCDAALCSGVVLIMLQDDAHDDRGPGDVVRVAIAIKYLATAS